MNKIYIIALLLYTSLLIGAHTKAAHPTLMAAAKNADLPAFKAALVAGEKVDSFVTQLDLTQSPLLEAIKLLSRAHSMGYSYNNDGYKAVVAVIDHILEQEPTIHGLHIYYAAGLGNPELMSKLLASCKDLPAAVNYTYQEIEHPEITTAIVNYQDDYTIVRKRTALQEATEKAMKATSIEQKKQLMHVIRILLTHGANTLNTYHVSPYGPQSRGLKKYRIKIGKTLHALADELGDSEMKKLLKK